MHETPVEDPPLARRLLLAFALLATACSLPGADRPRYTQRTVVYTPPPPLPAPSPRRAAEPPAEITPARPVADGYASATVNVTSREGSKIASCLGVMVAPRVAITAGHCVVGRSDTTVERALTPAHAKRSEPVAVSSIWFDPNANTRGSNVDTHNSDLAILVLQRPLPMPAYALYARGPLRRPTQAIAARHVPTSAKTDSPALEPMGFTVRASPRPNYYLSAPFGAPGDSGSPILVRAPDGKLTVVAVLAGGSSEHELLARTDVMSDKLDELVVSTASMKMKTKTKTNPPKPQKQPKPPTGPSTAPNVTWL